MSSKIKSCLPSLAEAFFLILFLVLVLTGSDRLLRDGDTGVHIRAGELMLRQHAVLQEDPFSFFTPPIRYVPWDWLSEVIMGAVHLKGGLTGIVVFFAFLISLIYYLLFRMLRQESDVFLAVLLTLAAIASTCFHWLARPFVFSHLLFLVFYWLLDRYERYGRFHLYWLPPLMLLWVNLHGAYILGPILIFVYLLGNLQRSLFNPSVQDRPDSLRKTQKLGLVLFLSLGVALINPQGMRIFAVPFRVVSDRFFVEKIMEFRSPNFHQPFFFEYLVYLMIACFGLSRKRPAVTEVALVTGFLYGALHSVRHIPFWVILVSPLLARYLSEAVRGWKGRFADFYRMRVRNIERIGDASWGAGAWLVAGLVAAVLEFAQRENIRGRLFTWDEFGDYVIYKGWPQFQVPCDGRIYIYDKNILKAYEAIENLRPGWKEELEKYDFNWILAPKHWPLAALLSAHEDWKLIYSDKVADIFVRDIPENQPLVVKYPSVTFVSADPLPD